MALGGRGGSVVGGAKVDQVVEGARGDERRRTWERRKADLAERRVVEVSIVYGCGSVVGWGEGIVFDVSWR